ncbi:MAG: flagellar basal body-associated FliL family protein [Deltaproteobacteria bacterium]|jgi:flagellar FliL protein|nr:flagellar basal body-associated FliL family protein [Deltaproteobacteria bacterium]
MAKDKKEDLDEKEQQPEPKKKSRMKWIIIGAAALIIIASGAGAGYYFFFSKKDVKATSAQQPVVVTIWPMEAFIINIADTNGERYLKVVIQLEVSDPTVVPELEQLKPRLRDSILDLLTPKTYKELMDLAGKQRLREDIAGRVNNILTKGKVTKVYITDFVVQ